jgi:hypothetical protein
VATVPHPSEDLKLWNTAQVGPYVLPGRFECDPIPLKRNLDVKKPGGKSGASITDKGYELAKFKGRLHITSKAQHDEFQRILPHLNPRREGATKDPFELKYATVIEAGITAVTIEHLDLPPFDTKSKRVITFTFQEWVEDSKPVKKGTGKVKDATQRERKRQLDGFIGDLTGTSRAPGQLDPLRVVPLSISDPADPTSISSMIGDLTGQSVER